MDRVKIKEEAKAFIRGKKWDIWKPTLIVAGIVFLAELIIGLIFKQGTTLYSFLTTLVTVATVPMTFGLTKYYLNMIRDKEYNTDMLFAYYKDTTALGSMVLVTFVVGLCIAAGTILLVVPGIIMGLSLYFFAQVYLDSDMKLSVRELLHKCREMMNGHKMDLFVFFLSFIGWILLGSLTLGILYIWLMPYMTIAEYKFYEELKK